MESRQLALPISHNDDAIMINGRWLLALYAVVPLLLLVAIVDTVFFEGTLQKEFLPRHPAGWAYWALIFNLPHIVASWVTFADKEYLHYYRKEFSVYLPLTLALVIIVHELMGGVLAFIIFGFYTMYHVLSQQFGLSMLLMGVRPTRDYEWWRWLSTLGAMSVYAILFSSDGNKTIIINDYNLHDILLTMAMGFLLAALVFANRIKNQATHRLGVIYMWANVVMLFACVLSAKLEYFAFVVMMPRIVHDVTAFIVYATHDHNRNRHKTLNYIYRVLRITKLPVYLLCPVAAIAIAYPLTTSSHVTVEITILTLTYFHYYFEAFIWKGQAPHRQSVTITR